MPNEKTLLDLAKVKAIFQQRAIEAILKQKPIGKDAAD